MELTDKEFSEKFKAIKEKAKAKRKEQINTLNVSSMDKDLRDKITSALRVEELIEISIANRRTDVQKTIPELYSILSTIRQRLYFYSNLAQIRKQERTNKILTFFTKWMAILIVLQLIFIGYQIIK